MIPTFTALSLLFIWLAALVLAGAACAYFIASIRLRRISKAVEPSSSEQAARVRALSDRISLGLEIAGVIFFVVLIFTLAFNAIALFRLNAQLNQASQRVARRFIAEEYRTDRLTPGLSFAVTDDWTVGGASPRVGDSLVITAKLMSKPPRQRPCSMHSLRQLASRVTLRLASSDLRLSSSPIVDDNHACYVAWKWVAVVQHAGTTAALVELTLRDEHGQRIQAAKPIHFAVPARSDAAALAPSITSLAVALLSIAGALLTGWLNRKSGKADASE